MKEQVMYDKYKDISQEMGKIGEATVVEIVIREGITVMKEKDMMRIGEIRKIEIGIGKEIPEK
jgi:translation initiation factor IF-2